MEWGCRQGCPLSPLLFAISIDPLAHLIRDDSNIKGITIIREEHKLSLYADDVLLFLTEATRTTLYLKELLIRYRYYSSYKVNMDKTKAMDISGQIPKSVKVKSGLCQTP